MTTKQEHGSLRVAFDSEHELIRGSFSSGRDVYGLMFSTRLRDHGLADYQNAMEDSYQATKRAIDSLNDDTWKLEPDSPPLFCKMASGQEFCLAKPMFRKKQEPAYPVAKWSDIKVGAVVQSRNPGARHHNPIEVTNVYVGEFGGDGNDWWGTKEAVDNGDYLLIKPAPSTSIPEPVAPDGWEFVKTREEATEEGTVSMGPPAVAAMGRRKSCKDWRFSREWLGDAPDHEYRFLRRIESKPAVPTSGPLPKGKYRANCGFTLTVLEDGRVNWSTWKTPDVYREPKNWGAVRSFGPFTRIEEEGEKVKDECVRKYEDLEQRLTDGAIERHVHAPLRCETCQQPREYVSTEMCKGCLEKAGSRKKAYDPGEYVEACRKTKEFNDGWTNLQYANEVNLAAEAKRDKQDAREAGSAHFSWRFGHSLDGGRK